MSSSEPGRTCWRQLAAAGRAGQGRGEKAIGRGRRTERLVDAVRRARVVEEHLEAERLGAHRHRRAHETCTRTRHLIYYSISTTNEQCENMCIRISITILVHD